MCLSSECNGKKCLPIGVVDIYSPPSKSNHQIQNPTIQSFRGRFVFTGLDSSPLSSNGYKPCHKLPELTVFEFADRLPYKGWTVLRSNEFYTKWSIAQSFSKLASGPSARGLDCSPLSIRSTREHFSLCATFVFNVGPFGPISRTVPRCG